MYLKRSYFAAVGISLLAMSASPALAADLDQPSDPTGLITSGVIDLFGGVQFISSNTGNTATVNPDTQAEFGGSGRLSFALSPTMSVQMDVQANVLSSALSNSNNLDDNVMSNGEAGIHISWRNPSSHLLGIFGGGATGTSSRAEEHDGWFIGGEGQLYFENTTLYAQFGYFDGRETSGGTAKDAIHNAFFGRIVGRYFYGDMTRFQAEFAFARGKQDNVNYDTNVFGWGVRVDHTFEGFPLNMFLKYRGSYYDNKDSGNGGDFGRYADHSVLVGFTVSFGAMGLRSQDRNGATLDLPEIGRWISAGDNID